MCVQECKMPCQNYSKSSKKNTNRVTIIFLINKRVRISKIMNIPFWSRTCMQTHFKLIELQLFPLKFSVQASAGEALEWMRETIRCELNEFSPFWRLLDDGVKITWIYNIDAQTHFSHIAYRKKAINWRKRKIGILHSLSQNASNALLFLIEKQLLPLLLCYQINGWPFF